MVPTDPGAEAPRPGGHPTRASSASWGLVDQAAASVRNFALSVVAARILGPAGLGVVAIGFSVYLTIQALHHSFVVDPLVVATAGRDHGDRSLGTRAAITTALGMAAVSTVVLLVAGLLIPQPVGRGLLLFAPWAGFAVIQDMWRSVLFRDGHGRGATANDALWLVGMAVLVPVAWKASDDWVVVATWGGGAALAAVVGFAQVGLRPLGVTAAWTWLCRDALPLGRWLGLTSAVLTAGLQGVIVIVALLLGSEAVGGLRAAQVVFAPMTLLFPGLGLTALPELTRAAARSARSARVAAGRYSMVAVALVAAYLIPTALLRDRLLTWLFGSTFVRFGELVVPFGAGQLLLAAGLGHTILLRVLLRGRALLICQLASSLSTVALVVVLSHVNGVDGAAWGMAAGLGVGSLPVIALAVMPGGRPRAGAAADGAEA